MNKAKCIVLYKYEHKERDKQRRRKLVSERYQDTKKKREPQGLPLFVLN